MSIENGKGASATVTETPVTEGQAQTGAEGELKTMAGRARQALRDVQDETEKRIKELMDRGEAYGKESFQSIKDRVAPAVKMGGTVLKSAKENLINGFALRLDTNKKILEHVAMIGFYELPLDYLDDYPKQVAKVTTAQIREAFARRIRPEHLVTVIVAGKS